MLRRRQLPVMNENRRCSMDAKEEQFRKRRAGPHSVAQTSAIAAMIPTSAGKGGVPDVLITVDEFAGGTG